MISKQFSNITSFRDTSFSFNLTSLIKCRILLSVSKADNDVHFGRSVDSDGSRITLSYKEIIKIVDFDLSNSFFKIGSYLGKQTVGIPMGSPLSPALAVIVCAFYENRLYKMIENFGWNNTIVGTRYAYG